MKAESSSLGPADDLLAHVGWIREVARGMVADANRADDLAQDACVVALETPPRDPQSIRGWLHSVLRNLRRQGGRGELRRRAREAAAARAERLEGADDLLERAEMQRRIVEAVLDLEEPYRSTILWRYFEDEAPREIARRLGVPATTVQSRLKRGLARLRERLEASRRDRGAWLALLAPLAGRGEGPLGWTLGGVIVNAKLTVAVVSLVVLATVMGVAGLRERTDEPAGAPPEVASAARASAAEAIPAAIDVPPEPSAGTRLPAAAAPAPVSGAPAAAEEPPHRVRGHVLDADAHPVGGLALAFEGGAEKSAARSGGDGSFAIETRAAEGTFVASDATVSTVRRGSYRATSSFEPVVIVAPAIAVGGTVLDPGRLPLQGARVSLALPKGFETRFGQILEATRAQQWSTLTDAQGRFTLAGLPQVAGSSIQVLVDGYQPAFQPEPELSDPNLCFVLERPAVLTTGALRGRVLDLEGSAVGGARVAAGLASTVADEQGRFVLDLSRAATAERVTAVKEGFRPGSLERPDAPAGDRTGWPDFVEIRLGGPALAIRGRVVDPAGHPRAAVRVWIGDPTPFGLIGRMPVQSENLMAGALVPPRLLEPDPNPPKEDGNDVDMRRIAGAPPTASWYWVVTGDDGSFELRGLDDRDYKLRILDTKTLQIVTSDPIAAGDPDARIVMPPPAVFPKLAGRVVTVGDRPVAGARVLLRTTPFEVHTRYFGGKIDVFHMNDGGGTTADAEGRFEFRDVPREGVFFVLRSDRIVPCDWELPAGADPENLDVRVDVRCQLEVRLKAPLERADSISLRDGEGQEVDLITADQERISFSSSLPLVAGRSGVLSASSSSRVLELRKDGAVVERVPVELVPDEVTLIEP